MKPYIQLSFFAETNEERLQKEINKLKESQDKMRKSQFAKISELKKQVEENKWQLDQLKSALCRYENVEFPQQLLMKVS